MISTTRYELTDTPYTCAISVYELPLSRVSSYVQHCIVNMCVSQYAGITI
jgi:hypothetical protein